MIKRLLIFLALSFSIFAFKIDDIDLNINVKAGETKEKTFTLINDKSYPLKYRASIEDNVKNIKVTPNNLIVPAHSKKQFKISVQGEGIGEKRYFLVLEEEALNLKSEGSTAKLKMKYRIEHKYMVD